jgi:hypothetical protein
MDKIKSAIQETRDQLFLDRADGEFLTVISTNLGIIRPDYGFASDSLWRALVRRLALDTRQIENCFRDLLTLIFGPQVSVVTVLDSSVTAGDWEIIVSDQMNIPQLGTMVVDETLPSEETIEYEFRDPRDGTVELATAAANAHAAGLTNASSFLRSDVSASGTSLPLWDSSGFPTSGFPQPILIDPGTDQEEVVQVTANTVATNTLTCGALTYAHSGPTVSFVTSSYSAISAAKRVLTIGDSENFPDAGYIRVQEDGGGTVEDVEYTSNDLVNNQLQLKTKLQNAYTNAEVTLLREGDSVQLSQIKVLGADWQIYQTSPRALVISIPEVLDANRLQDATFLHSSLGSATNTTVSGAHSIGDTELTVAAGDNLYQSGSINIDSGTEYISYTILRLSTFLYASDTSAPISGIPIGTTELLVADAASLYAAGELTKDLIIDRSGTSETVTWTSVDLETNKVTLASATTAAHSSGDTVEVTNPGPNTLRLSRALANAYTGGETVAPLQDVYSGTDLADGRIFTVNDHLYQGSYLWELLYRVAESDKSTLDEDVAGPTALVMSQRAGRTALEVKNAALFNTSNFQEVYVGRGLAGAEKVQINGVTLKRSATAVSVNAAATAGDTTLTITPSDGIPNAKGYRIFIDDDGGGTGEEVVLVESVSGTTLTLDSTTPLAYNHSTGDDIVLLADVIKIDALAYDHDGIVNYSDVTKLVPLIGGDWATSTVIGPPNVRYAKVEEVRSYIDLVDASDLVDMPLSTSVGVTFR